MSDPCNHEIGVFSSVATREDLMSQAEFVVPRYGYVWAHFSYCFADR